MRSLLTLCAVPALLVAQNGHIEGVVVGRLTGEPLSYSIVTVEGTSRSQFSTDSGRFSFRELAPRTYVLQIRRLGYAPHQVTIEVRAGNVDSLRVELDRVAVTLTGITVRAFPPCTSPGAPPDTAAALSTIVSQLKLNAEQLRFLAAEYPYETTVEVHKSRKLAANGLNLGEPLRRVKYRSTEPRRYKPGEVLYRSRGNWVFEIPELVDLANPAFIAAHCWHYAGIDTIDDVEHYRVDVVAADTLSGVDVNGSFLISSRSFQIRRSVLHFSKRPTQVPTVIDMETTTEFFEVLPSVPIISSVKSVQTIDPQKSLYSQTIEDHRTLAFQFRNRKPGTPTLPGTKP